MLEKFKSHIGDVEATLRLATAGSSYHLDYWRDKRQRGHCQRQGRAPAGEGTMQGCPATPRTAPTQSREEGGGPLLLLLPGLRPVSPRPGLNLIILLWQRGMEFAGPSPLNTETSRKKQKQIGEQRGKCQSGEAVAGRRKKGKEWAVAGPRHKIRLPPFCLWRFSIFLIYSG